MTIDKTKAESVTIKVLLVIVGFLLGIGAAHLTTMNKVAKHEIKISTLEKMVSNNTETNKEVVGLMKEVINQNNLLIQKVIVKP